MLNFIRNNSIFKDNQAVALMSAGAFLTFVILVYVFLSVESRDFKVDVRYSGYDRSLSDKGEWYTLYVFPLSAVSTYFINTYLSIRAHKVQRMLSIVALSFNIIVLVFGLMVTRSLMNLL